MSSILTTKEWWWFVHWRFVWIIKQYLAHCGEISWSEVVLFCFIQCKTVNILLAEFRWHLFVQFPRSKQCHDLFNTKISERHGHDSTFAYSLRCFKDLVQLYFEAVTSTCVLQITTPILVARKDLRTTLHEPFVDRFLIFLLIFLIFGTPRGFVPCPGNIRYEYRVCTIPWQYYGNWQY